MRSGLQEILISSIVANVGRDFKDGDNRGGFKVENINIRTLTNLQ